MIEVFELSGHANLSSDALADLARRTLLCSQRIALFYLHCHILGSTAWQAFYLPRHIGTKTAPIFRSMRSLRIAADCEAIRLFLEAMPPPPPSSLSSLLLELDFTLHLFSSGGSAYFALFAAVTLHLFMLRLRLPPCGPLQGADMLSAVHQRASPLRELSLPSLEDEPLVFRGFDDAVFETLVAVMLQLEVLRLEGCGLLTLAVFRLAGACCWGLRMLKGEF